MGIINNSVGKGAQNNTPDVRLVKFLLNRSMNRIYPGSVMATDSGATITAIRADEVVTPSTIKIIEDFQKNICGYKYPDGRVDPGRTTIKELALEFVRQGGLIGINTKTLRNLLKPNSVYTKKFGSFVTTGEYHAGKFYPGLDGTRLVLSISESETIFLLCDNLGPDEELKAFNPMRGKVGGIYRQRTSYFVEEFHSMFYHKLYKRLQPLQRLIELEANIIIGIVSASSGIGFVVVLGVDILQFYVENKHKFPIWEKLITAFAATRTSLKKYAPTLYDKLYKVLFQGVKVGALAGLGLAGDDILNNVPKSMTKDTKTTGRLIGALVGGIGKVAFTKRLTILSAILSIAKTLAGKAIVAIPGSMGITSAEGLRTAREIVTYIKSSGISISENEGKKIVDEVSKYPKEIMDSLNALMRAIRNVQLADL